MIFYRSIFTKKNLWICGFCGFAWYVRVSAVPQFVDLWICGFFCGFVELNAVKRSEGFFLFGWDTQREQQAAIPITSIHSIRAVYLPLEDIKLFETSIHTKNTPSRLIGDFRGELKHYALSHNDSRCGDCRNG